MRLMLSILLFICSMLSISARDLQIEIPHSYYSTDTLAPENIDLPIYNINISHDSGLNIIGILELLANNQREKMYIVACYEKNDTIRLQIEGFHLSLYSYIKDHIAGVHIVKGWREIPFFFLSTPFDPRAHAMGMFSRGSEMATIKWLRKKLPESVLLAVDSYVTSFIYYYEDKQWHPKSLIYNGTNLLNF